ncbi:helicase [Mycobacterium sherrisii]|nr:Rv3654c family TadE-like protein [Mycobacterium sherrisii]ORW76966.1 helicase [Mycobacterium sherrisii]
MLGAAMVLVLLCVVGACLYVGAVVVARHRAQSAADLAALAAAAGLPAGAEAACARASAVAHSMRVDDIGCRVDDLDVIIAVGVAVRYAGVARAVARAGPVDVTG